MEEQVSSLSRDRDNSLLMAENERQQVSISYSINKVWTEQKRRIWQNIFHKKKKITYSSKKLNFSEVTCHYFGTENDCL